MTSGRRQVVAVVLAAGVGSRVGADRPKQLLRVGDRTILERAVGAFTANKHVDDVLVVTAPAMLEEVRRLLSAAGLGDVRLVEGGAQRTDSTRAALEALGDRDCDLLLHDAARPLVDDRIIADCVHALVAAEAVTAAVPSTDTIAAVTAGQVTAILDRSRLANIQTPQGFRLSTIRAAYRLMDQDRDKDPTAVPATTDDCGVILRYLPHVAVHVVEGSARNLKVTRPDDVLVAERLLATPPGVPPQTSE